MAAAYSPNVGAPPAYCDLPFDLETGDKGPKAVNVRESREQALAMDPATRRNLEISETIRGEPSPTLPSHWTFQPLAGEPEALAEELRAYARQGIGHVQVWLEPNTLRSLEAFAPVLAALDRG